MAKTKRQRRAQPAQPTAASRVNTGATSSATSSAGKPSATAPATNGKSAASATRLAEIRARTPQRPQNRRRYAQQPWWRRNLAALSAVAVVALLVIGFVAIQASRNKATAVGIGSPVPQSVLSALVVSDKTAAAVAGGGVQIGIESTPANVAMLTSKGLPEVIYVGAEYCPYCAAERWSTIIALNRFGSFKGLTLMQSSPSDVFASTNTFTFKGATYTSKYLVFNATETEDRSQQPLDTPPAEALQAFNTYDTTPYTTQQGGIPFVSYANQYVTTAGPYQPTMLQNLTWQQIAAQLSDPNSAAAKAIIGTANYQTAAICKLTNNQPASVCNASYIKALEATLPAR